MGAKKTQKDGFMNLAHARTPEQIALMQKIEKDGVCPFCAEHFKKYHPKPIIKETSWWFVSENMSPYQGTKYHFILVYKKKHISSPSEVSEAGITDLFKLVAFLIKKYEIPGGSFFMRFGESKYTGGSVSHLHTHLIMGDADDPKHEAVRVKLG